MGYRLDWSRPITPHLAGERAYHATDGERHILVVLKDDQLELAQRHCRQMLDEEPEITLQQVIELGIARALIRPSVGGELRLRDEDLS
jgi:hypothetical protein